MQSNAMPSEASGRAEIRGRVQVNGRADGYGQAGPDHQVRPGDDQAEVTGPAWP